jgi:hypothetical protein
MAERIFVPGPGESEELRQLSEAVADLHYMVEIIVENAKEFVPGEAVDELTQAWRTSSESMQQIARRLYWFPPLAPPVDDDDDSEPLFQAIAKAELTGDVGQLKKSMLRRLKDTFFMYWYSEPRNDEKRAKTADAAEKAVDFGATLISSIPHCEKVVEFLSVVKQLIGMRAKRDF